MKISGFSFVRNAKMYDYPVVESILSVLPICDEFIILVGNSSDDTLDLIKSINSPKIEIYESIWDDSLKTNGKVLAVETDKAFKKISKDSDWAFYLQADEIVHEADLDSLLYYMECYKDNDSVDGLLFNYLHFYGSYDFIGSSGAWYPHEIRIVKNKPNIYSYRDAQGFRKDDNIKLNVIDTHARIFHYGWVRKPEFMALKNRDFAQLYSENTNTYAMPSVLFDYKKNIDQLKRYRGSHPKTIENRINSINWQFNYDISFNKIKIKDRLKMFFKKYLGLNFYYKNYRTIKE